MCIGRRHEEIALLHRSEVIAALSFALDLTEGQPQGHSIRACIIGIHLAREIGLPKEDLRDLYYALLLKDAGCSANASKMASLLGSDDIAAKRHVKTTDWARVCRESVAYALAHVRPGAPFLTRMQALFSIALHEKRNSRMMIQVRCERGAAIARRIGFSERTASAIHSLDEHWDGAGHPQGLRGREIPLFSRIMNLAQTAEVFHNQSGADAALSVVQQRKRRWFDPELVRAYQSLARQQEFWEDVQHAEDRVLLFAPTDDMVALDEATMDSICLAFADVIDAKSPFTYRHSSGVNAPHAVDSDVVEALRFSLRKAGEQLSIGNTYLDGKTAVETC